MSIFHDPVTEEQYHVLYEAFGITANDSIIVEPEVKIAKAFLKLQKRVEELEKKK